MSDQPENTTRVLGESEPATQGQQEPPADSLLRLVQTTTDLPAGPAPTALVDETIERAAPEASVAAKDEPRIEWGRSPLRGGRSVIGLDVGERTIKIVHLQTSGSAIRLLDAHTAELPPKSDPERFDTVSSIVAQFVSQAKPRVKAACCAISGEGVATVCSSVPRMGEKDLAQAVRWKVAETAGVDVESATVGYYTLNTKKQTGNVDVVAAAAPLHIDRLDTLFPGDRPQLAVVISRPVAAENVVMAAYHAQERAPVAVLDIGTASSKLSVVGQHGLEFTREIPVGGDSITTAIAGKMTLESETIEISRQVAIRLKKKYTIGADDQIEAGGIAVPASRILGAIRPVLERLASEVVRSLQFYAQSHSLTKAETLLICGGGATLGGLAEYLTQETRIAASLLDPWRMLGVEVPSHIKASPALFAVATGAAIHDAARVNLLPPHIKARRTVAAVRTGSVVATACALVALVGLSWTAQGQRSDLRKSLKLKKEATAPMEQLAARIGVAGQYNNELARRKQILRSLGVGKPMHAAILKELSNIMPKGTYLRSLSFKKAKGIRRAQLSVDIYSMPTASSARLKQRLIAALEDSPFFVNVSFTPSHIAKKQQSRPPDEALRLTCQVLGFPGD